MNTNYILMAIILFFAIAYWNWMKPTPSAPDESNCHERYRVADEVSELVKTQKRLKKVQAEFEESTLSIYFQRAKIADMSSIIQAYEFAMKVAEDFTAELAAENERLKREIESINNVL